MFNLKDMWRITNPDAKNFTWIQPDGSVTSRVDPDSTASISAPLKLHFISSNKCFKKGYLKLNSNLLKNEPFCQEIIDAINDVNTDDNIKT